ncbi:MAG: hypothetical protein EOP84_37130 [Verrucomicrobiaceae bacterium]|nr:MAG: hypothetical protein EOP84_37130 [Verrucomicrobiaceae bacterium]
MMRLLVLCVIWSLPGSLFAARDWLKESREAKWKWPHENPTLLSSAMEDLGSQAPYEIAIIRHPWQAAMKRHSEPDKSNGCFLDLKVFRDGKVLFQRPSHERTVFVIRENRLYFADFSPLSCGCKVLCFDLETQKLLWETTLQAAGNVNHSIYRNRVSLAVLGTGAVQIFGWEDAGRYVEYLDLDTGAPLAHRIFE